MKIKQFGEFLKKNVFYVALGAVVAATMFAVFFMPTSNGNVDPSAYEPEKAAIGKAEVPTATPSAPDKNEMIVEESTSVEGVEEEASISEEESEEVVDQAIDQDVIDSAEIDEIESAEESQALEDQDIVADTFASTTASEELEPYFAENDSFIWPITGEVVVPYKDENTRAWFSVGVNQTMRTFGIGIKGEAGQEVKAIAKGTVVEITNDSSELCNLVKLDSEEHQEKLENFLGMLPYIGNAMVIDHGNNYMSIYGFQQGTPNADLKGQVVSAGDVLGTVGGPSGAFLGEGNNIYLSVIHEGVIIDPQTRLEEPLQVSENTVE